MAELLLPVGEQLGCHLQLIQARAAAKKHRSSSDKLQLTQIYAGLHAVSFQMRSYRCMNLFGPQDTACLEKTPEITSQSITILPSLQGLPDTQEVRSLIAVTTRTTKMKK